MSKNLAIYIHWPFCKKKCPYCDFNSHVRDEIDHVLWAQSLTRELNYYHSILPDHIVSSVFFGGGTPSLMRPETVQNCLDTIKNKWKIVPDLEVTLEANPTSSEADKFKAFEQAGVNRLSIGVQSFDDHYLKFLGREHSADDAKKTIEMAAGIFDRFSFDMIYGRPEQTPEHWEEELKQALAFDPGHISLYQLTIEEGTEFFTRAKRGDFIMPDSDQEEEFYDVTQTILNAAGLPSYEISNHARAGEECRHNLSYWRYEDYIGIGPGAHGRFVDGKGKRCASRNHKVPEIWLERVRENCHGTHPLDIIEPKDAFEEMVMVGLRLREGISLKDINKKASFSSFVTFSKQKLDQLAEEGYLVIEGNRDRIRCTRAGLKTLNSLLVYLLSS